VRYLRLDGDTDRLGVRAVRKALRYTATSGGWSAATLRQEIGLVKSRPITQRSYSAS